MQLKDKIRDFVKIQSNKNIPTEETSKVIFMAHTVSMAKTIMDFQKESPDMLEKIKHELEGVKDLSSMEEFQYLIEEKQDLLVNKKGESIKDVFERNMVEFLDEVEKDSN